MAFRISTAARNAACDAIVDLIDVGSPNGTITILTGAQPATVGGADAGVVLGTLNFAATAFGAASSGVATAAAIASDTAADASGTAGHFTVADANALAIADGTCGQGSGDMNFDNNVIVSGGIIACTAFTVTVPVS